MVKKSYWSWTEKKKIDYIYVYVCIYIHTSSDLSLWGGTNFFSETCRKGVLFSTVIRSYFLVNTFKLRNLFLLGRRWRKILLFSKSVCNLYTSVGKCSTRSAFLLTYQMLLQLHGVPHRVYQLCYLSTWQIFTWEFLSNIFKKTKSS